MVFYHPLRPNADAIRRAGRNETSEAICRTVAERPAAVARSPVATGRQQRAAIPPCFIRGSVTPDTRAEQPVDNGVAVLARLFNLQGAAVSIAAPRWHGSLSARAGQRLRSDAARRLVQQRSQKMHWFLYENRQAFPFAASTSCIAIRSTSILQNDPNRAAGESQAADAECGAA